MFETDNLVMLKSFLLHQQRQVSKVFQKSFKIISRKFYGCFESPLRVVQGSFKISKRSSQGVSRQFQRCFNEDSRVLKKVSSVFQENFIKSFEGVSELNCIN